MVTRSFLYPSRVPLGKHKFIFLVYILIFILFTLMQVLANVKTQAKAGPLPAFVKVFLAVTLTHPCTVCGCFQAELNSCNRDPATKNISYLAL